MPEEARKEVPPSNADRRPKKGRKPAGSKRSAGDVRPSAQGKVPRKKKKSQGMHVV